MVAATISRKTHNRVMVGLVEIFEFITQYPEVGWVLVILYLAYELRGKRGRIYSLDKKITSAIVVIRALSRADDDIDEDEVADYLVENGMEPDDFLQDGDRGPSRANIADGSFAARSDGEGQFDLNDVIAEEKERVDSQDQTPDGKEGTG